MKRYLLSIILTLMMCGTTSAQPEFMNGYIIKKDGSYTYGQVKFIARGYTVKECVFRWFDISNEYTFLPGDIEAFEFTHGMRYKAVTSGGQEIFMACLVDGLLDLLFDGKRLYLDGMGLDMVQLDDDAGSVNAEGKMVSYNGYRDLVEKLPDPANKFTPPADIPLKPEKMTEVIASYNESRDAKASTFPLSNPSGIYEEMRNLGAYMGNYGVLAGMNASRYYAEKVNNSRLGFVPEMDFFEMTPLLGLFYNRPLTRGSDLISLHVELMAFKTNVYIYDEYTEFSGITRSDISISFTSIKMPVSLRISLLEGNYKPFLNAGVFIMTNLGGKYIREGEVENYFHVVRPFTDTSISVNKSINGLLGGIGLKREFNPKQSLTVELRAEYGSGIYDREGIDQHTVSFNIIAGFDFR